MRVTPPSESSVENDAVSVYIGQKSVDRLRLRNVASQVTSAPTVRTAPRYFMLNASQQTYSAAVATPCFDLVTIPTKNTYFLTGQIAIDSSEKIPTLAEFEKAVFDVENYPKTGKFLGFAVNLLEQTKVLKPRANASDSQVFYQVTSANDRFGMASRHYVLAMRVVPEETSKDEITIECNLVHHPVVNGRFAGPYADTLNANTKSIYTPFNRVKYKYNVRTRTLTYTHLFDNGGKGVSAPKLVNQALMALPIAFLEKNWGIDDIKVDVTGKMLLG